jgi:hypothetical protein
MSRFIRLVGFAVAACWGLNASATTVVLDFEGLPTGVFTSPLLHKGFYLDPALAPSGPAISGAMYFCPSCIVGTEGVSIYSASGALFELDSLDIVSGTYTGVVTGHVQGGGILSQAIGPLGTLLFDSSWINLVSIDVQFNVPPSGPELEFPGFDNVVIQAVPVPAAVWLFASALGILGAACRNRGDFRR